MHHIVFELRVTYNQQSKTYFIYNERQQRKATNPFEELEPINVWHYYSNNLLIIRIIADSFSLHWLIVSVELTTEKLSWKSALNLNLSWLQAAGFFANPPPSGLARKWKQTSETGVGCIKPRLYFALFFLFFNEDVLSPGSQWQDQCAETHWPHHHLSLLWPDSEAVGQKHQEAGTSEYLLAFWEIHLTLSGRLD